MRLRRYVLGVAMLAALALASACSVFEPGRPARDAEAEPATTEAVQIPGRPDAPAPVDGDFRADPASVVAATGRPQLIEFFAFW